MNTKSLKNKLLPVILLIILLLLWEYVISNDANVTHINETIERLTGWWPGFESMPESMLPRPSKILRQLTKTPKNGRGGPAYFLHHTGITLAGAGWGFLIGNLAAMLLATIFLYCKPLERAMLPIALAMRSVPNVALTPLLLRIRLMVANLESVQNSKILYALFGSEMATKVFLVVMIVFFPTLVNVSQGLNSVSTQSLELMKTYNASKWQVFWKLRVPTSLPMTFAALKNAAPSAVMGIVIAEWLSSDEGLGCVIYQSYGLSQVARMMMAMFISGIISIILFLLVGKMQDWLVPWSRISTNVNEETEG